MARKVTLFTGQLADLPLTELAKKAASWGYDGLELACWGDHMDTCVRIYRCVANRDILTSNHNKSNTSNAVGHNRKTKTVGNKPPQLRRPIRRLFRRKASCGQLSFKEISDANKSGDKFGFGTLKNILNRACLCNSACIHNRYMRA